MAHSKKVFTKKPIYAFIDASNLFYGGAKSLGWKIDYKKLLKYLKEKYSVSRTFYYGGIEIFGFDYSILERQPINLRKLISHLKNKLDQQGISEGQIVLIDRNLQRAKFYLNLEKFGYYLRIKPVKIFVNENGKPVKKANCDVDMTFDLMRYMQQYAGLVALTGDGDFAPVLCYLKSKGREIKILARGERTAKELKQLVGADFRDFHYLREILKFETK